jgi:hypothetical protein
MQQPAEHSAMMSLQGVELCFRRSRGNLGDMSNPLKLLDGAVHGVRSPLDPA